MSRKARAVKSKGKKEEERIPVNIFRTDMSDDMQKEALKAATEAFMEAKLDKDLSAFIKKRFDSLYTNSTWHCIVGSHFAVSISHATKYLIFFNYSGKNILLFKSIE